MAGPFAQRLGVDQHAVGTRCAGRAIAHDELELVLAGVAPGEEEAAAVGAAHSAHLPRRCGVDLAHARQQRLAAGNASKDLLCGLGLTLHPCLNYRVAGVLDKAPRIVDHNAVKGVAHRLRRQRRGDGHAGDRA